MLKLKGVDISHHNSRMKNPAELNNYDFVIMKATEGTTYEDPALSYYMRYLVKDKLKGFYHYCRPENKNTPEKEASNFLSHILKYMDGRCILAIDVEGNALNFKGLDDWVLKWCQYVYLATGIKPMIYTSEAYTHLFPRCAAFGVGLWCAKWSVMKPTKIAPWKFFAIWQKTSNHMLSGVRVDLDYFNGDESQYLKYCRAKSQ